MGSNKIILGLIVCIIIVGVLILVLNPSLITNKNLNEQDKNLMSSSKSSVSTNIYTSQYDGTYKILKQDAEQSLYNISFESFYNISEGITYYKICHSINNPNVTYESPTIGTTTYKVPLTMNYYEGQDLIKQSNLKLILIDDKSNVKDTSTATSITDIEKDFIKGDTIKFCTKYLNPYKDTYIKIGDNSTVVVSNTNVYTSAVLNNVTIEPGNFSHLSISNTVPYNYLIGYWNFDGDKANTPLFTAYDFSSLNRDGTAVSDTYVSNTNCWYGNCTNFDGINDRMTLSPQINGSTMLNSSACVWIDTTLATTVWQGIIEGSSTGFSFGIKDNYIRATHVDQLDSPAGNTQLATNTLYHICYTYNTTYISFYLNGVSDGGGAWSRMFGANVTGLGSRDSFGSFFRGSIDELMIFNTTLSPTQISQIYNNQSVRYFSQGFQDIYNVNVSGNGAGNENKLNISLNDCQTLLKSNLSATIGINNNAGYTFNQSIMNFTNCNITNYTFVGNPNNISLRLIFLAGNSSTNSFYSPLILGNITLYSWNVTVAGGDTTYPTFSSNLTSPVSSSQYVPNANYQFNITIANTNGTAGIEFNGINYTLLNLTNSFYKTLSNLGAGTYNYFFWAYGNGTSNLFNKSITYSYVVAKNITSLSLTATTPITYGTITNFVGSGCNSQISCSLNLTNAIYSVGTLSANYSTNGNTNYTASSAVFTVTINKKVPNIVSTVTSPITYGTTSDFTCTGTNSGAADLSYNLNISNAIYGAGTVNANCSTIGGQNYTINSTINTLTINKANPNSTMSISGTTPITYPSTTDVAGSGCPSQLTCSLFPPNAIYGVGTTTFNYSTPGNTNYTANFTTKNIIINQNTSALVYTYLNNSRVNITIYNNTAIYLNVTLLNIPNGIVNLYKDNVLINSGTTPINDFTSFNGTGVYNITGIYSSNTNYSGAFETWWVNVSTAICYPNLMNTTFSNWINLGCIGNTGYQNESRYTTQYDNNFCVANVTIYEYRSIFNASCQDLNPPTFNNLRNFTQAANKSFSQSITASDSSGIGSYKLNDTSTFSINSATGLITNAITLSTVQIYWLNISVNDTWGNLASGIFYINITPVPVSKCGTTFTTLTVANTNQRVYGRLCYWLDFK